MPKKVWTAARDAQLLAAILQTSTISYDWTALHSIMNADQETEITMSALNHRVRHFKGVDQANDESAGASTGTGGDDNDGETKTTPTKKARAKKSPTKPVTPRKRKPSTQAGKVGKSPKFITKEFDDDEGMDMNTPGGKVDNFGDTMEGFGDSSLEDEDKADDSA